MRTAAAILTKASAHGIVSLMRAWMLSLPLLIAACGQPSGSSGQDTSYDATGSNGVRVNWDSDDHTPSVAELEAQWTDVAECMGVTPPDGPLIVYKAGVESSDGSPAIALLDLRTIMINSATKSMYWTRHEMIHLILDANGFPRDRNRAHDSPYFFDCVLP